MAKLDRKNVKIFSSNPNDATQVTTFLTAKDVTPSISSDPDIIQNANYEKGWLAEGNNDLPQCEDMNGVMFTESYKTAYLYQQGIAEWIVTQEYFENSFCQVDGIIYKSLVDNNIGNDPTTDESTNWLEIPFNPYVGENLGNAEGIYAGKTINNELQFKSIAVSGNGNISSSNDTITIEIGGGGTGDVYWGAIGGTLSNQSDLQQALNQKQGLIGYTPEDVANKVTTIRTDTIATDTAYPTELATRTAIDDAITSANDYTDNALLNLSSDVFILYAETWTDANTGTLTTVKPTGNGTTTVPLLVGTSPTTIATFSYTTTSKTVIDPSFFYDIYIQCSGRDNSSSNSYLVDVTLTIEHPDVLSGVPSVLVDDRISYAYWLTTTGEIRTPIKTQTKLDYPAGSVIKLQIKASAVEANSAISLLVYDSAQPIVISRNQYLKDINATCIHTQTPVGMWTQEDYNTYLFKQIQGCAPSFTASAPLNFYINSLTIAQANTTTNGYLTSTDWNTFNGKQNAITASSPLSLSSNTLSIAKATSSASGYLSSTDWNTFNNKVSANNSTINIKMNGANKGSFTTNASSGSTIDLGTVITSTSDCAKLAGNNVIAGTNQIGNVTISAGNISRDDGAIYLSAGGELRLVGDTQVRIRCSSTGAGASGNFRYYGKITAGKSGDENPVSTYPGSDIRLKKDIKETTINGIETINKINIKEFRYKTEDENHYKHIGVIAQEVEKEAPEIKDVVLHGEDDKKDMLVVEYGMFTPYLIKAVQELSAKVEKLEARVKELEDK